MTFFVLSMSPAVLKGLLLASELDRSVLSLRDKCQSLGKSSAHLWFQLDSPGVTVLRFAQNAPYLQQIVLRANNIEKLLRIRPAMGNALRLSISFFVIHFTVYILVSIVCLWLVLVVVFFFILLLRSSWQPNCWCSPMTPLARGIKGGVWG